MSDLPPPSFDPPHVPAPGGPTPPSPAGFAPPVPGMPAAPAPVAAAAEPSKPAASSHGGDETVTRRPDVERRTYELLYKSGRWELVTELNKETEQSIQNAFKSALETQD